MRRPVMVIPKYPSRRQVRENRMSLRDKRISLKEVRIGIAVALVCLLLLPGCKADLNLNTAPEVGFWGAARG